MTKYSAETLKSIVRRLRQEFRKPTISERPLAQTSDRVFLQIVGATYHQNRPDAMMVAREGYCNAFLELGYDVRVIDFSEIEETLAQVDNPIAMIFSSDLTLRTLPYIKKLQNVPTAVWVPIDFDDKKAFLKSHGLEAYHWKIPTIVQKQVDMIQPKFVFSATLSSGEEFFQGWENKGYQFVSLPLALDTTKYKYALTQTWADLTKDMSFVGGYWASKGQQLDLFLKPYEERLQVYGYSRWPYRNYNGQISVEQEIDVYQTSKICPVINEPTVKLLHGQINERVFKILGSGGFPITDTVPQYSQLFDNRIPIAETIDDFHDQVQYFLKEVNFSERNTIIENGYKWVLQQHTYRQRAETYQKAMI